MQQDDDDASTDTLAVMAAPVRTGEERKSFLVFLGVGLGYVALATALAVLRTNRRDIT